MFICNISVSAKIVIKRQLENKPNKTSELCSYGKKFLSFLIFYLLQQCLYLDYSHISLHISTGAQLGPDAPYFPLNRIQFGMNGFTLFLHLVKHVKRLCMSQYFWQNPNKVMAFRCKIQMGRVNWPVFAPVFTQWFDYWNFIFTEKFNFAFKNVTDFMQCCKCSLKLFIQFSFIWQTLQDTETLIPCTIKKILNCFSLKVTTMINSRVDF